MERSLPEYRVAAHLVALVGLLGLALSLPHLRGARIEVTAERAPAAVAQAALVPERAGAERRHSAAPAAAVRPASFEVLRVRRGSTAVLRARPRGPLVARLDATTEFGSPQTLAVVARRGSWLGVVTPALSNGRLAWVKLDRRTFGLSRIRMSLTLDLSRRALVLKRDGRVVRRMTVGIGRPGSTTPRGRFAVTDKLPGSRYSPSYGCCIVALTAHQPNLPPGWRGGDRIAIHGTNQPSSIGVPSSAGCPHASDADLRVLMRHVPLGTPVFIRA